MLSIVFEEKVKQVYFSGNIYFHVVNAGRVIGMVIGCSLDILIFTITMTTRPMTRISVDTAIRTGISIRIKLRDDSKLDLISSTYFSGSDMPCKIILYTYSRVKSNMFKATDHI